MYLLKNDSVPTKLRRIAFAPQPAVYEALERYAARTKRSMSNAADYFVEQMLIQTGDLAAPIPKPETRGGRREKAGRKPKTDEQPVDNGDETDG